MKAKTRTQSDREYDFVLELTGVTEVSPAVEDALFEAGCDDATISARGGRVFLTFSRTATSLPDAVRSATEDVSKAGFGATVANGE